jgi:hypothetical protein
MPQGYSSTGPPSSTSASSLFSSPLSYCSQPISDPYFNQPTNLPALSHRQKSQELNVANGIWELIAANDESSKSSPTLEEMEVESTRHRVFSKKTKRRPDGESVSPGGVEKSPSSFVGSETTSPRSYEGGSERSRLKQLKREARRKLEEKRRLFFEREAAMEANKEKNVRRGRMTIQEKREWEEDKEMRMKRFREGWQTEGELLMLSDGFLSNLSSTPFFLFKTKVRRLTIFDWLLTPPRGRYPLTPRCLSPTLSPAVSPISPVPLFFYLKKH